jgi:hypothetical protein
MTYSRMAQPRVRIGPMPHSRSSAPRAPGLIVGLGQKRFTPTWAAPWPERWHLFVSIWRPGAILERTKHRPTPPTETLAHFACFSSLSRTPHRASQHRQSASKRRREPSQRRVHPPVGGRACVERHHGVANRLNFFLGRRKPEPVFFPHGVSTTDAWSAAVET